MLVLDEKGITMFNFLLQLEIQTILFSIFLLFGSIVAGFIIEKFRSKKFKTVVKKVNIVCSPLIMILFLLVFKFNFVQVIKYYVLFTILFHASYCDIKRREVDDYISVMILLIGLINFNESNFFYMFLGAMFVFLPQIIMTAFSRSVPIGGADIKISTTCGFVFGPHIGLSSLCIGLISALIVNTILAKRKKQKNISFPFIPYFFFGLIISFFLFPAYL